jgi:hypothetical protein
MKFTLPDVEKYLHDHIPLTRHLGVTVSELLTGDEKVGEHEGIYVSILSGENSD